MDNATYHKNQGRDDFHLPKNIELFFLPPYSPDFNFIEKLWKVLRDDFFNNKFFKNLMNTKDIVLNVCNVT